MEQIVKSSKTYREILNHFGMDNKGGNFRTLKRRILEDHIGDSHIIKGSVTKYATDDVIETRLALNRVIADSNSAAGALGRR